MPDTAVKISAREAANAAAKYVDGLVPMRELPTIEEVEYDGSVNEWKITLGFIPAVNVNTVAYALGNSRKEYKIFRVNEETGEVISMKIRKID